MADFLFEIGLEEIPARMIAAASAELLKRTLAMLERERLLGSAADARSFSTPRRLAVLVHDVLPQQPELSEELLGPAARIAFQNGVAGPAAIAFARKSGVPVEALRLVPTAKGEYVAATVVRPGRPAAKVLAEEMPKELAGIYWPKNMYWRAGKPERFVRPLRWMLALLGDEVVPVEFGGFTAARSTYGHRVLSGPAPIPVRTPASYAEQLLAASVMADVELRRHTIRKALDRVCRTVPGGRWREDRTLVDKMTHMTEWPSVLAGTFDPDFLMLPQEVLVTVMRDHQNYFAVEDESGKLLPNFLAVLNTAASTEGEAVIRHGNERVLRARFTDARFFWEFDQRVPLEDRVALLEHVTFQKDLGSYALKSIRVANLAETLGGLVLGHGSYIDEGALATAARLAKTDLTTELVKEFTELQGEVGGLYARAQGIGSCAADAIYDHYRPVSMEARIPHTVEGQLLALADKADTIASLFMLGMEPTGSKDPFALRRAANGIVKILGEGTLPLTLENVISATCAEPAVASRMQSFFAERLDFYLREAKGQSYDVVKAVLAAGADDVRNAIARCAAITAMRGSEDFLAVSAAFKRMKNILRQASEEGDHIAFAPSFDTPGESAFWTTVQQSAKTFSADLAQHHYEQALASLASLRVPIDNYFADTMVRVDDLEVRANRLGLLTELVSTFTRVADFSEIVSGSPAPTK